MDIRYHEFSFHLKIFLNELFQEFEVRMILKIINQIVRTMMVMYTDSGAKGVYALLRMCKESREAYF